MVGISQQYAPWPAEETAFVQSGRQNARHLR